jgi:pSer/pThr/pTyr-binding forkhead associated (FHA) protein
LIGRLEDLCDVAIDNQTVSRKHAILQAKSDDHCLYLYDLGSAHGTFVNKEKLPVRTFKKLSPFDNVKFGISSRIYVLRCPEYEEMMDN